ILRSEDAEGRVATIIGEVVLSLLVRRTGHDRQDGVVAVADRLQTFWRPLTDPRQLDNLQILRTPCNPITWRALNFCEKAARGIAVFDQESGRDETERLSALIGDIYDAALDPALWADVLRKVRSFETCQRLIALHIQRATLIGKVIAEAATFAD